MKLTSRLKYPLSSQSHSDKLERAVVSNHKVFLGVGISVQVAIDFIH